MQRPPFPKRRSSWNNNRANPFVMTLSYAFAETILKEAQNLKEFRDKPCRRDVIPQPSKSMMDGALIRKQSSSLGNPSLALTSLLS